MLRASLLCVKSYKIDTRTWSVNAIIEAADCSASIGDSINRSPLCV